MHISGVYCYIIPKRCFENKEEFNNFVDFLYSEIDRKKFKVKGYKFDGFSPDSGEIALPKAESAEYRAKTDITDNSTPIMEVTFTNTKEELLKANLIVWSDVVKVLKLKSVILLFTSKYCSSSYT
ncbi:MAG: hypothetical protein GX206_12355 [Clostridiales bacterium]|nr:hypothetical protein [Clostridiales bacterium]